MPCKFWVPVRQRCVTGALLSLYPPLPTLERYSACALPSWPASSAGASWPQRWYLCVSHQRSQSCHPLSNGHPDYGGHHSECRQEWFTTLLWGRLIALSEAHSLSDKFWSQHSADLGLHLDLPLPHPHTLGLNSTYWVINNSGLIWGLNMTHLISNKYIRWTV